MHHQRFDRSRHSSRGNHQHIIMNQVLGRLTRLRDLFSRFGAKIGHAGQSLMRFLDSHNTEWKGNLTETIVKFPYMIMIMAIMTTSSQTHQWARDTDESGDRRSTIPRTPVV